ncbi:MAG: DUF1501 domain-containing protein [Pirellulales bacterium]|nr:DUF1501 domain-containing protein [Pirellulales bacterium]
MTNNQPLNRREMLARSGMGFASLGLGGVLADEGLLGATADRDSDPLAPRAPHFAPKAKHVIHIFLNGGCSQVDTFDPKPVLNQYHGKPLPYEGPKTEFPSGSCMGSGFKFKKCGQSGIEISEIFPNLGRVIDDVCVIRSMKANTTIHEQSLMLMNCGHEIQFTPCMGSWLTYGLGSENRNLPGFIVLCPGKGDVVRGAENWRAAFLPPIYQGTLVGTADTRLDKMIADIRNPRLPGRHQRRQLDLVQQLNREHLDQRGDDSLLESRIQSYEMAYRMQAEATDAFDINREPEHILRMYGDAPQSRQLLIARRLIERGVRFVQTWHGDGQPWDNHQELERSIRFHASNLDPGLAALITDLKQRGLFDETLILVCGEFGRTPTVQLFDNAAKQGRDHSPHGFTALLAGGGIRGGMVYGATDDFGYHAIEKPVHVNDLQATMLHQLGLDHQRLTYRYAGRDFRLTNVHGKVVHELLA